MPRYHCQLLRVLNFTLYSAGEKFQQIDDGVKKIMDSLGQIDSAILKEDFSKLNQETLPNKKQSYQVNTLINYSSAIKANKKGTIGQAPSTAVELLIQNGGFIDRLET